MRKSGLRSDFAVNRKACVAPAEDLLETGLVFLKELVKVMEEHPVEHGALRISGTVNSCHSRGS
jgi:hypothetical protein